MDAFFMPTINLMGKDAVLEINNQIKTLGCKKPLIVTDKVLAAIGLVKMVTDVLDQGKISYAIFDGTSPNPTVKNVEEGTALYKKENCDMLIAVGGGSPIDCAKGIGLVIGNGGSVKDFEGVNKSQKPMPHFIAVNTTAGTASEMTRFTIITDTDRHVKMAIVDWRVTPTISINDPELMVKMPASLTAATGMDALTHSVEAYVSTIATPLTDCLALEAIRLIQKWLRPAYSNGENREARLGMAYAEFLAGMAFNNASLGFVHAMAHQLGGFYDLPHGVCNAILLPHVQRFNLVACPERFVEIAKALGEKVDDLPLMEAAERAIIAIQRLASDVGIPAGLKDLGVKEKDFPTLAENAMKDVCNLTNPRKANKDQVIQVFKNAL
jgi:alcohol dehydrogenase